MHDLSRNANATRFSQSFEARCHVHAVTKDIVAVDDDVAKIDANAISNALVLRNSGFTLSYRPLDFNGTSHRVDNARKFDQQTVARGLDNSSVVFGDLWVE